MTKEGRTRAGGRYVPAPGAHGSHPQRRGRMARACTLDKQTSISRLTEEEAGDMAQQVLPPPWRAVENGHFHFRDCPGRRGVADAPPQGGSRSAVLIDPLDQMARLELWPGMDEEAPGRPGRGDELRGPRRRRPSPREEQSPRATASPHGAAYVRTRAARRKASVSSAATACTAVEHLEVRSADAARPSAATARAGNPVVLGEDQGRAGDLRGGRSTWSSKVQKSPNPRFKAG